MGGGGALLPQPTRGTIIEVMTANPPTRHSRVGANVERTKVDFMMLIFLSLSKSFGEPQFCKGRAHKK